MKPSSSSTCVSVSEAVTDHSQRYCRITIRSSSLSCACRCGRSEYGTVMHPTALSFRTCITELSVSSPDSIADAGNGHSVPPTTAQKFAYGGFTVVIPYLLSKAEGWLTLSNDIAPAAWKDRLQRFITIAENIYSTLSLLNFLAFLVNGRYLALSFDLMKLDTALSQTAS